ncbi:3-oxoadipate enol-lactonase [Skermanella stibiiresistens SB22]|uniref:3-oxoadipate enol-lactonase n=1 Tax=Skermanella stibiiresistens SB22 TaxID=1385369 RepID=W9GUV8_9PROT|nr:3-oxoadipate enol-lactonase [Skermanella stibiiresistens]EWY36451.1 3-oxoadipate enol-lactonase [Skermanella stibiiresistens SB22]
MPSTGHVITGDGTRIFHRFDGEEGSPVLLLSNSLGTTLEMWDPQIPAFSRHFRVLRYDSRGHGRSDAPQGPYDIARLGRDAVDLLQALAIRQVSFCGLSKGGMIGMWLAVNAAERVDRLVLANTSAFIGSPETWTRRIETVDRDGMAAIVPGVIERWFTPRFRDADPTAVDRVASMLAGTPPQGYIACCAAVRDMDQRDAISAITAPTLVIAGDQDLATPPAHSEFMAGAIAGAKLVRTNAAHLSNVERSEFFTEAVLDFLTSPAKPPANPKENGHG